MAYQDPIDEFIALPRDQQLSTLQSLSPEKQDKLLAKIKERRSSSKGPAPRKGPEARTVANYASEGVRGVGRGLRNDYEGLKSLRHPIKALDSVIDQGEKAADAGVKEFKDTAGAPLGQRLGAATLTGLEQAPVLGPMVQHAEEGGEKMGSPEAFGAAMEGVTTLEAPGAVGKAIKLAPRVAEVGPRAVKNLVKDTQEENAKTTEKYNNDLEKAKSDHSSELLELRQKYDQSARDAQEKARTGTEKDKAKVDASNLEAKQKYDQDVRDAQDKFRQKREKVEQENADRLREHSDKTQAAKSEADQRSALATRKSALEHGVKTLSDKFQQDLKATRDEAHATADAKYKALDKELGGETVPSGNVIGHLLNASEIIKNAETSAPILSQIEKAITNSDHVTYDELQGYYSKLGTAIAKGGLQGDVYTAYNAMQDAIGDEMQRVADRKGKGQQLLDARASWRNLKQTFYDPKSPLRKALTATEAGDAIGELAGKDRSGIQALARYNPDLARRANTIRGYADEAAAIRVPGETTKRAPELAPRKPVPGGANLPLPPVLKNAPAPRAANLPLPPVLPNEPEATVPRPAPKKIGVEDIEEAKGQKLQKRADLIRDVTTRHAVWRSIAGLSLLLRGGFPGAAEIGEGY